MKELFFWRILTLQVGTTTLCRNVVYQLNVHIDWCHIPEGRRPQTSLLQKPRNSFTFVVLLCFNAIDMGSLYLYKKCSLDQTTGWFQSVFRGSHYGYISAVPNLHTNIMQQNNNCTLQNTEYI
jgi:hypothetical protein